MSIICVLCVDSHAFVKPAPSAPPSNCSLKNSNTENFKDLVHKVTIRGDSDDRVKDNSKSTNGALKVICKDSAGKNKVVGSAQLVQPGSIVTTAAHLFYDKQCVKIFDPSGCSVVQVSANGADFFNFDEKKMEIGSGNNCPLDDRSQDWAVIKLKRKINATSVKVCEPRDLKEGQKIKMISAQNKGQDGRDTSRLVQTCQLLLDQGTSSVLRTSCDTEAGNSGSGVFLDNCMIGILHGDGNDYGSGHADFTPADPYANYGYVIPINSSVLSAIERVSK